MRRRYFSVVLLASLGGCGYFNTMYNAKRSFADAEKAAARGDLGAAETAYRTSMEKARKSIAKDPSGRWSGEARSIVGRSLYALGDHAGAATAFRELLEQGAVDRRATALTYLGLIAIELGEDSLALVQLDAALATRTSADLLSGYAHLARARVHLAAGHTDAAATDLITAASSNVPAVRSQAELMRVRIALLSKDSASARRAFASALTSPDTRRWGDTLRALAGASAEVFGGARVRAWLEPGFATWAGQARDSLVLLRTDLALLAGDTALAASELEQLAARSSRGQADRYRVSAAELRLALARTPQDLVDTRAFLLPAIASPHAVALVNSIKIIEVLLERAARPDQRFAYFAAAEIARDDLGANRVALQLFSTFADVAAGTVWAPKALLAAMDLDVTGADQLRSRFESYTGNPYVSALARRGDGEDYAAADSTMNLALQAIRTDATLEAVRRDNSVTRAVYSIDSLRITARLDSTRLSCGRLLDSLAVKGIRADSIRSACERDDRNRIGVLIKIDTLRLRDTTRVRVDTIRGR